MEAEGFEELVTTPIDEWNDKKIRDANQMQFYIQNAQLFSCIENSAVAGICWYCFRASNYCRSKIDLYSGAGVRTCVVQFINNWESMASKMSRGAFVKWKLV